MARIKSKFALKKYAGKCAFCHESDYSTLQVHRIFEGYKGGTYHTENAVVCCSNCHNKIHAGSIVTVKKHRSFGESQFVLEYSENGETKYLPLNY